MAEERSGDESRPRHAPLVPPERSLSEFTLKALLIGLVLSVVLGAANAYLGLKAGMTIAATYPAAVIGMALMRILRGNILEENFTRTVGSIGESVAAGAIFTIPAFIISGVWKELRYYESTAIMMLGGVLGVLFVTMLRRVMVADPELPYPESVAAAEIHKAGRTGGTGAALLFFAGLVGAIIEGLKQLKLYAASWAHFVPFSKYSVKIFEKVAPGAKPGLDTGGGVLLSSPSVSPAFLGVGYILGPRLAALNFCGGLIAWGLFIPLLLFFLGPSLEGMVPGGAVNWEEAAERVWKNVVRRIAIGGMLFSAVFTLWRMRQSLIRGLARSVGDLRKAAAGEAVEEIRTERDIRFRWVAAGIAVLSVLTFLLYWSFAGNPGAALVAAIVMVIAGFFFAAVSGYLVGLIGSSNNPISGLTLSTVIVAAILMVALGQTGQAGVAAVLGVAGVICVSAAVAGEMLQDLKVGHILGGTPWKMQTGDIIGVLLASVVMFFPLVILHEGDIKKGLREAQVEKTLSEGEIEKPAAQPEEGKAPPGSEPERPRRGLGGTQLTAPQASLMAMVSDGIIKGTMEWPLIIVGAILAFGLVLVQVRSPMLVFVGMYISLGTSFAIFLGGLVRGIVDKISQWSRHNAAQKARVENTGVLLASGLIAGEALMGLVFAGFAFFEVHTPEIFKTPSFAGSVAVFVLIGLLLTILPISRAGDPSEPAPPSAVV